jgi:hypothetical protein
VVGTRDDPDLSWLIAASLERCAELIDVNLATVSGPRPTADVVMVRPPAGASPSMLRRLTARERGAVLVPLSPWPEADLRLELVRSAWLGLERGHGRLQARRALVRASGRDAAVSGRRAWLRLPDEQARSGRVSA